MSRKHRNRNNNRCNRPQQKAIPNKAIKKPYDLNFEEVIDEDVSQAPSHRQVSDLDADDGIQARDEWTIWDMPEIEPISPKDRIELDDAASTPQVAKDDANDVQPWEEVRIEEQIEREKPKKAVSVKNDKDQGVSHKSKTPWLVLGTLIVFTALTLVVALMSCSATQALQSSVNEVQASVNEVVHEHNYVPTAGEPIHHEAETHEVVHPAVYETKAINHTVCNECGAVIDGVVYEHMDETGHSGYTTNVPINETVLVSNEWVETVVDRPAYDETTTYLYCLTCGDIKDAAIEAK